MSKQPADRVYFVMRTHSHTDRQMLWKVMSRGLPDVDSADKWLECVKAESKNDKHEFFIVKKVTTQTEGESTVPDPLEWDDMFNDLWESTNTETGWVLMAQVMEVLERRGIVKPNPHVKGDKSDEN